MTVAGLIGACYDQTLNQKLLILPPKLILCNADSAQTFLRVGAQQGALSFSCMCFLSSWCHCDETGSAPFQAYWGVRPLGLVCAKTLTRLGHLSYRVLCCKAKSRECKASSGSASSFPLCPFSLCFPPDLPAYSIGSRYLPLINKSLLWPMALTVACKLML